MLNRIDSLNPPPKAHRRGQPQRPENWLVLIGGPGETSADDIEAFFADIWPEVGAEAPRASSTPKKPSDAG